MKNRLLEMVRDPGEERILESVYEKIDLSLAFSLEPLREYFENLFYLFPGLTDRILEAVRVARFHRERNISLDDLTSSVADFALRTDVMAYRALDGDEEALRRLTNILKEASLQVAHIMSSAISEHVPKLESSATVKNIYQRYLSLINAKL
ncbi:MAG: hypothetical protein HY400_01545 [Elusimicrobia bacterium]|nr:hypothetical protein [Elusimicrobiota bacterium]